MGLFEDEVEFFQMSFVECWKNYLDGKTNVIPQRRAWAKRIMGKTMTIALLCREVGDVDIAIVMNAHQQANLVKFINLLLSLKLEQSQRFLALPAGGPRLVFFEKEEEVALFQFHAVFVEDTHLHGFCGTKPVKG
jgi:hypothetical protein